MNAGQSCIAAKRMIVCEAVYPAFRDAFCQAMAERQPGDPLDPASRMGPLASPGARARLGAQVVRATAAGARLLLGGAPGDTPGCAFPPTVLEVDHAGVLAPDEECFGPVAMLLKVADEAAAIAAANATAYGLGASVWSANLAAARRVAAALDAGMVTINDLTVSDPRLPFGGIKASGLGRELGALGVLAFTNPKVIRWAHPPAPPR
jgi:succinate-semialdehyde dehydrogenase/glutarate-semialdehyde dehydrogenase